MTRFIDLAAVKKMIAQQGLKLSESVIDVKAVAPVKDKEQVGAVIYRRKAKYGAPFQDKIK
ncbi:hypothetical protein ACQCPP_30930 (plasmid) [Priestia megaterium]|uniref:hypothetical protein n=1 Tax=Priestia megaterium TaxID=1404 RepID=UPI003D003C05